jgi:DNA-binding phage protein
VAWVLTRGCHCKERPKGATKQSKIFRDEINAKLKTKNFVYYYSMSTKKKLVPAFESFEKLQVESFRKNPNMAFRFLKSCLEDNDPRLFYIALSQVSKALHGKRFSTKSKNPRWKTINSVLASIGFRLVIQKIK